MNSNDLKAQHQFSLKGILYAYNLTEIYKSKSFKYSIFLTIITFILQVLSDKTSFDNLMFWVSEINSLFPNLLGFSLGGYALIVGFGNSELLKSLTEKVKGKKVSIFQEMSALFAFTILVQIAAFLFSTLIGYVSFLDFQSPSPNLAIVINVFITIAITFMMFWGVLLVPMLVLNIFSFGQAFHFKLTIEKMQSEKNKKESDV